MRTQFAQIFWGLLLVILDFSINGFDLLVDGLGYLIVAAGCGGLLKVSPRFLTARTLCFISAFLWLLGLAIHGEIAVTYGFVTTVVNCMMMWELLGGIRDFALASHRHDLAHRAHNRRLAYCVLMIVASLIPFAGGLRNMTPVVVCLVIATLVLMAMILHLVHRVKIELA